MAAEVGQSIWPYVGGFLTATFAPLLKDFIAARRMSSKIHVAILGAGNNLITGKFEVDFAIRNDGNKSDTLSETYLIWGNQIEDSEYAVNPRYMEWHFAPPSYVGPHSITNTQLTFYRPCDNIPKRFVLGFVSGKTATIDVESAPTVSLFFRPESEKILSESMELTAGKRLKPVWWPAKKEKSRRFSRINRGRRQHNQDLIPA